MYIVLNALWKIHARRYTSNLIIILVTQHQSRQKMKYSIFIFIQIKIKHSFIQIKIEKDAIFKHFFRKQSVSPA